MAEKLAAYRAKRDPQKTAEPFGDTAPAPSERLRFVVQKHDATRLHYDFRLEHEGVMLSWAVTRGPSLDPADKRLAVEVEPHPLDYGDFEGTIPKGEYGGGAVMLWDRGYWAPEGMTVEEGLRKGDLKFTVEGERMRGGWVLVRMAHDRNARAGKPGRTNWLLIKHRDGTEHPGDADALLTANDSSVASGRTMAEIAAGVGKGPTRFITAEAGPKRTPPQRVWNSNRGDPQASAEALPSPSRGEGPGMGVLAPGASSNAGGAQKRGVSKPSGKPTAHTPSPGLSPLEGERGSASSNAGGTTRKRGVSQPSHKPAAPTPSPGLSPPRQRESSALPPFIPPQLARSVDRPPAGPGWVHEIKFDGYRLQLRVQDGACRVLTRNGLDWTARFQEVADDAARLPAGVYDGEAVVLDATGAPDFAGLQSALERGRTGDIVFFAFDVLHAGGKDLRERPLSERKTRLAGLLAKAPSPRLRFVEHFETGGDAVLSSACSMELEGIVSKRLDAPYRSGRAAETWVKAKCRGGQEVVVAGWVSEGAKPFRSLIAGVQRDGRLVHVGRIGTGFSAETVAKLLPRLREVETDRSPFAPKDTPPAAGVHWLKPVLVAEIQSAGWTGAGHLRQASFKGLREDKPASEVVQETPAPVDEVAAPPHPSKAEAKAAPAPAVPSPPAPRRANGSAVVMGVTLSNPDKPLWPADDADPALTKLDLARYFEAVGPALLPHLAGRPASIIREPDGIAGETFFQRHAMPGTSSLITLVDVRGDKKPYIQLDRVEALAAVAQTAGVEIHPWNCAPGRPEVAGRLVFDLDPAPDVAFEAVIAAAKEVKARLEALGLEAFCKTTGGKGLHVVTPLDASGDKGVEWTAAKAFARDLCLRMAADSPDRFLVNMAKAKRTGKIFLDYLRNDRLSTAVAPYSPRGRPGAPVSWPVSWSQVKAGLDPLAYTIRTAPKLLARAKGWDGYDAAARPLTPAITARGAGRPPDPFSRREWGGQGARSRYTSAMRPEVLFPLFAPVGSLKGVGAKLAPLLEKVAGPQVRDLAFLKPTGVIDRPVLRIAEAVDGEFQTFVVTVDAHQPGAGRTPHRMRVADETGFLHLIWFGPRGGSLAQQHPVGAVRAVSGKVESFGSERQITHPEYLFAPERAGEIPRHEPVYPATAGLTSRMVAVRVREAVERAPELAEWQDAAWLSRRGWAGWRASLEALHAPRGEGDLLPASPARARLAYDELLAHQLAMALRKRARRTEPGAVIRGGDLSRRIEAALPFRLTGAQRRTLSEIGGDLASGERMTRLVQGDVGSGKTAVAMLAMADAAESGRQSALMAPTEILARQHFETLGPPLEATGLRVVLLTGRDKGAVRADKLMALASGEAQVAVGTHALFQDEVRFRSLALAVVDEQHRFGVNERRRLQEKGEGVHLLALSATPIPRTLELTLYGDLDVSKLDEKPVGRKPVTTTLSPSARLPQIVERLRAAIDAGAQAFWICPLVAESDELTVTAAEVRAAELRAALGPERVGLAHGQLPAAEKDAVMAAFAEGRLSVLVATTVVEVGVNVPDATIMVIEHAERFGLAQLHQLRGRVGRGEAQSACVLLYDAPLSEAGRRRLEVLRETEDGFVIAQRDLDLRGGGDLLGSRQSGLPAYRFADPLAQRDLVEAAAKDAQLVLARDPHLTGERAQALAVLRELFDWRWEDGEWSAAG